jgi:PAS domain S-box-containing protein
MSADILLVAPYPSLKDLAEKVKGQVDLSFDIVVGNLNENRDEIDAIIEQGVKVVLSRGGTAQYLRERLDIPVVDIPATSYDILNAISLINRRGFKKIAFITTRNIIVKTEHFNEIMDISLYFEPVKNTEEIPHKVQELIQSGFEAIVGDVIATRQAVAQGIYGQLLESGYESLLLGLQEAKQVLEASQKEKARVKQMEAILNMITEAVLTIDKQGQVTLYNTSAEKVFGYLKKDVIGHQLTECIPESKLIETLQRRKEEKNLLIEVNHKKIISNRIPILIDNEIHGAVAIFEEVSHIQKLEMNIRTKLNEKGLLAKYTFGQIENNSEKIQQAILLARQYANSDGTVLIYGETGTGKEVFAQSIHNESRRAAGPFVSVNCAALSESLLESELFGYEEGAFTGASKGGKRGLFEIAHRGSVFLDEIGEISPSFQAKLLRVLQEKEIRRVGGDRVIPVNIRILCATNRDLRAEVNKRHFREDLYYRLTVLEIKLPPLRERKADIVPMAISFLKQECVKENRNLFWHDDRIFQCLLNYEWYGNARELHNFINRLVICSEIGELKKDFIEKMISVRLGEKSLSEQIEIQVSKDLKKMESEIILKMLDRYNGDKEKLCREYGISKTTLWRKLNFKNEM